MDNQLPELLRTVEHELTALLRRGRAVSWGVVREVHPHLEPNTYGLLLWLRRSGAVRLTDLSVRLGVGKGTLSRQIRGLEELGLVRREPDPEDRRAARLSLTVEGQRRFDAARGSRVEELQQSLAGWSADDLAEFARLLHHFNENWTPER
ncbi:MarR family winged helix-turn-helix transcriptional regulator [Micromonospora cathayae]|uniref:MarR family transcriptional regulator n=1 Tax=Micromonospora cathayae TaxID=3028804 RepID=A0ABY7ZWI6_9ACTN|nr:MarR family transcriptional regulator [Micromonospora sp. HUAS 3]WDZ87427.1 MarR family transcriptional regulator [Micromonospora sp. HUAS 3]